MVWAEGQTCRVLRFFPTYLILGGLSAELNCARWFGSGCAIVFVIELNFPLLFPSMQVLIQMDRATQRLEPWKIAVIVVVVIAGLALIIGLLTFYLCHGKHTTFLLSQDFWNMLCFTWYCGLTWWFRYKIHPGIESTWEDVLDCTWVLNWLENLQEWLKYHLLEIGILVLSIYLFLVLPWCLHWYPWLTKGQQASVEAMVVCLELRLCRVSLTLNKAYLCFLLTPHYGAPLCWSPESQIFHLPAEWMQTALRHLPLCQKGHMWPDVSHAVLTSGWCEDGPQRNIVVGVISGCLGLSSK